LGCLARGKVVADFMYEVYRGLHQKKREGTRAVHEAQKKRHSATPNRRSA
jgi:hypothetical protein